MKKRYSCAAKAAAAGLFLLLAARATRALFRSKKRSEYRVLSIQRLAGYDGELRGQERERQRQRTRTLKVM